MAHACPTDLFTDLCTFDARSLSACTDEMGSASFATFHFLANGSGAIRMTLIVDLLVEEQMFFICVFSRFQREEFGIFHMFVDSLDYFFRPHGTEGAND